MINITEADWEWAQEALDAQDILRAYSPNKGKAMNVETTPELINTVDIARRPGPHYVLTIDPETGEEVKVELLPIEGEFSQEGEDEIVTVH